MLPKVFGVGEDLCPPDMRHTLTYEETVDMIAHARENYEKALEMGLARE